MDRREEYLEFKNQNPGEVIELLSRETFTTLLECQICKDIPLPPIYICENGHNICVNCRTRVRRCGLCSGRFLETRNLTLEMIIQSCSFTCLYKNEGCREIIRGEDMKAHLAMCPFKPPGERVSKLRNNKIVSIPAVLYDSCSTL